MTLKFFSLLATLIVFLSFDAMSQVNGVVKDVNGETLIGAAVKVKNTSKGTLTDIDGGFQIDANPGDILSVSYIGYSDIDIPVTTQQYYEIIMQESDIILDQVVVVGYGTQRKVDVTGSTVSVKGEELAKQPVMTATQALQGKVAGVQILGSGKPGESPTVRVRGVGTALAGTTALFVVDGVLTDDISNINTSDIVSMDVLKDASSTAIYGARGANGVIIITTKRGTTGATKINYNNFVGYRNATNIVKMANASEYANYASSATGQTVVAGDVSTDWYREILRNAFVHNHNLSISGGTEKMSHFLGFGYLDEDGIVLNNNFKRLDVRANLDYDLFTFLKIGLTSSYSNSINKDVNLGAAYNNAYRAAPIIPGKVDGRYGNTSQYQNVGNAILDLSNNDIRNLGNRLQASAYAEIVPLSGLKYRSMIGLDRNNYNNRSYNYQFLNDETTFLTSGGNQVNRQSYLNVFNEYNFRWVWDNIVTYETTFDKHRFTFLAGTTAEAFNGNWFSASRKDVPAVKDLWYINTGDANTSVNSGGGDAWARNSYLGRLNYNYGDKYLFTGTIRRDGSSRIAQENRWGWFPSFGVGWVVTGEDFMKDFTLLETLKLRASWGRVGNDRIPSDAFTVTITPNQAYPFGGGIAVNGSAITQVKDPNLKWETTEETDLGIDYALMKGRLYGEFGFYTKTTRDLLINVKLPATAGDEDGVILTNAASIKNTGFEAAINWRDAVSSKLSYRIGANITLNKNEVTGLNGGEPILDGGVGAAQIYTTKTDNGQPVGAFYVYQVLGVFQNEEEIKSYQSAAGQVIQPDASPGDFKYQDSNGDGRIDDKDRVFIGSYQPKTYFGLNAEVNYGAFDLSFDIYGNVGNYIYNGKKALRLSGLDNIEKSLAYGRWTPGSGIQDEPKANSGYLPASTYYIESGDFVRLNNVTLAYNLPESMLGKAHINSAKVFITGQNLLTLKKFTGFSPELSGDSPTRAGIELNAYPTTRTIAAGVNVSF
ncbi:MAG: TonB-dependent receptor [Saprospiraceae bacterium]|nr:MAG: TonB-linked outer membrane protein, SusC/RagA family [Bacteroidetes bacterium OLB9]MCO6463961.1 TonB-dependent receptor [Saprospiraceae bacterium]